MVQMAFKSPGTQKISWKRITQQGIVEEDLLSFGGLSHVQGNLNYNLSAVDKKQQIM